MENTKKNLKMSQRQLIELVNLILKNNEIKLESRLKKIEDHLVLTTQIQKELVESIAKPQRMIESKGTRLHVSIESSSMQAPIPDIKVVMFDIENIFKKYQIKRLTAFYG